MDGDRIEVLFSGDLGDPWVRALRAVLPTGTVVLEGPELPEAWPDGHRPGVVVLHRATLGVAEADRLRAFRDVEGAPKVVLVAGRHARYHHLMSWSGLVDVVLPEATARETIARHLRGGAPRRESPGARRRIAVAIASGRHDLATLLEDVLDAAGYAPRRLGDEPGAGAEPWVVWDVPVLEPEWPDRLAAASQRRGVVALLGLADRELVATARSSGAVACLDLPCDPDDLVFVLDRLTGGASPGYALRAGRPRTDRPRRRPGPGAATGGRAARTGRRAR